MIEAVNSVLANAAIVRASADQSSVVRSFAANPARVQEASTGGPQAPYVSPYIHLDINYDRAVIQIRDSNTGDVVRQFPSESTLEARRRADAVRQNSKLANKTGETEPSVGTQQSFDFETVSSDAPAPRTAPSTTGNAEAQAAAAALADSALSGVSSTGNVSITA